MSDDPIVDLNEMARRMRDEGYSPTTEEYREILTRIRANREKSTTQKKAAAAPVDIASLFKD